MTQEIRWRYRFDNFSRAYSRLKEALDTEIEVLSRLEQEGVIQRFEYTFELAWKVLKDRMEYDGVMLGESTPRNAIRAAAAAGLIADGQTWMDMLEDRGKIYHSCDWEVIATALYQIRGRYLKILDALYWRLQAEVADEPSIAPAYP